MEISELSCTPIPHVGFLIEDANALAFERGACELLLGRSYHARSLWKKVNYGCKHCLVVDDSSWVKGKGARAMDFNGLRSHLKGK